MIDELAAEVPPSAAQNVGRSPIRKTEEGVICQDPDRPTVIR